MFMQLALFTQIHQIMAACVTENTNEPQIPTPRVFSDQEIENLIAENCFPKKKDLILLIKR